jgi:hypothetical protein
VCEDGRTSADREQNDRHMGAKEMSVRDRENLEECNWKGNAYYIASSPAKLKLPSKTPR